MANQKFSSNVGREESLWLAKYINFKAFFSKFYTQSTKFNIDALHFTLKSSMAKLNFSFCQKTK